MPILAEDTELNIIKETVRKNFPFEQKDLGKFLRSKTGILILKSSGIKIDNRHLDFLSGIELIHNASLFHDDVIDNETKRRGEICIKERFNSKVSILYGNLLISKAMTLINSLNSIKLSNIIINSIEDMCRGELIQQSQIGEIPSLDEYLKKTELKTATLFKTMVIGLQELEPNKIQPLFLDFAKNYGIAFQIKNDLTDVIETHNDIKNGIFTAPYILADDEKLSDISLEKTVFLIDNYISDAINSLSELRESRYKAELVGVVQCLKD